MTKSETIDKLISMFEEGTTHYDILELHENGDIDVEKMMDMLGDETEE